MKIVNKKTFGMKNNISKYYITSFIFCYNIAMFAQPAPGNDTGDLEGTDAPASPIDNYIWVLALVGLIYVFIKLRDFQNKKRIK
jgi:hypothetical protein